MRSSFSAYKTTTPSLSSTKKKYEQTSLYGWFWSRNGVSRHSKAQKFIWRAAPSISSMACEAGRLGCWTWPSSLSTVLCALASSSLHFLPFVFPPHLQSKKQISLWSNAGQFYLILWSSMAKKHPDPQAPENIPNSRYLDKNFFHRIRISSSL